MCDIFQAQVHTCTGAWKWKSILKLHRSLKCIKDSCIVFAMFTEKSESDDTPVSSDAEKIDTMLGIVKNKLRASK